MMDPATANDSTSTPKRRNTCSPVKRNANIMTNEAKEALEDSTSKPFSFKSIMIGNVPMMSMTEKSMRNADKKSLKAMHLFLAH